MTSVFLCFISSFHFMIIAGQSPIINIKSVGPGDSFDITCDISRFRKSQRPKAKRISTLGVERKFPWDTRFEAIAYYSPGSRPIEFAKFVPPARRWDFTLKGGNYKDNLHRIKLTVQVRDGGYKDAALYRCSLQGSGDDRYTFSDPFDLRSKGKDTVGRVVDLGQVRDLVIDCDIFKFEPSDVSDMRWLPVIGAERLFHGDDNYTLMVSYEPLSEMTANRKRVLTPHGRTWDVQFYGGDTWLNKNVLSIVVTLRNVDCRDTALYRCFKLTAGAKVYDHTRPFNFTAEARVVDLIVVQSVKTWGRAES